MKVVVLIPAFNEEKTIYQVVNEIKRDLRLPVIVVDDGSIDRTYELARLAGANKIIKHKKNKGLGKTLKDGIEAALDSGADIIVTMDADRQFNHKDVPMLLKPIINQEADMVTCTRFAVDSLVPEMPFLKRFGNRLFTILVNILLKKNYTDTQCGFRAYSKEAALKMNLFGDFTYTQEVFLELVYKGFVIKEVPCIVRPRIEGKSKMVTNVFFYGIRALLIIILTLTDNRPLKFFGTIGIGFFSLGTISSLFLLIRWFFIHQIDPFMFLVYVNLVLIIVGFLMVVLALLADIIDRSRIIQEEILYRMKK